MNFIFVSPQFPHTYWNFCDRLRRSGVNVLGIGDAPYDELEEPLKRALTEYYRVDDMEDYGQMFRAVAFFSFKYGKIDWLESNNEYWLEQDARLRTDFHITTGADEKDAANFKSKSGMKAFYAKAGIPTARCHKIKTRKAAEQFVREAGFPVIVKPDVHVSTREAYAGVTPRVPDTPLAERLRRPRSEWQACVTNDFERSVFAAHPVVREAKEALMRAGAFYASMSGSGSAVFGLFPAAADRESLRRFGLFVFGM